MGTERDSSLHEGVENLPEARPTHSGHFDLMEKVRDQSSVVVSSPAVAAFEKAFDETMETWPKLKRIWLLRHFPFEKTKRGEEYRALSSKNRNELKEGEPELLKEWNETIGIDADDARGHSILEAVCRTRKDATIAVFTDTPDKILKRNRQTLDVMRSRFGDKVAVLQGCFTPPKTWHLGESLVLSAEMILELLETAKNSDWDAVLLWNRTFSPMFSIHADRILTSAVEAISDFEKIGYDYLDFDTETGKLVTKSDRKTLPITPDNYVGVLRTILWTERSERYRSASLPHLQEVVNLTLRTLAETDVRTYQAMLFELAKSDSGKGLGRGHVQAYAFERLMESGADVTEIDSADWSNEAIGLISPSKHREFIIRYLGEKENRPSSLPNLFALHARTKDWSELFADATLYWEIRQKQKRSVDPSIRSGKKKAIAERYAHIARWDGTERREYLDFEGITKLSTVRNAVVLGTIGEGKSLWLCEFAKSAILKGQKIRFYEARDLSPKSFERGGNVFDDFENFPEALFCIDGMDEIRDSETRDAIKSAIDSLGKRFIIASRPSEYAEHSEKYATVRLAQMELDDFLEGRFDDERDRERVRILIRGMRFSESAQSSQTEADPLLLAFACMLAENGDRTGVPDFRNRADLYENAAKYVLSKHSKDSKGQRDYDPSRDVNEWMKELGKRAYAKFTGTEETGMDRYSDTHLGLLYRKEGAEKYEFAHHSFYEYFLARHFAENRESFERKGHGGFPDGFSTERNSLLYHAEILANSGKTKELAEFLKKLRRFPVEKKRKVTNSVSVGRTPLVTWLEILHALPDELFELPELRKIRKKYEKDVSEIDAKWIGENHQEILEFAKRTDHVDSPLVLRAIDVFKSAIEPRIASKVDADDPMSGITELCKALASIGTPLSVSTADKIESVVRKLRMSLFMPIPDSEEDFVALEAKLRREDTQGVFWRFHKGKTDFEFHLAAVGTQSSMDAVESRIGHMPVDEMARMYETIAGGPVSRLSLEMARKGAEKMMEGGHYTPARWIYRSIFEMGTRKARLIALKWARSLEGKCRDPWKIWANSVLFDYKAPRRLPPVTDLSKLLVLEDRWGAVIRRVSKLKKRFLQ